MKIAKPKKVTMFQEGDRVKYAHPKFPKYDLTGIITGTYRDDRQVVVTDAGREWVLFEQYLSLVK